jgi:hypothetical protein
MIEADSVGVPISLRALPDQITGATHPQHCKIAENP